MGFIEGTELVYDSKSQSADYHDEMNGENYNTLLKERLIPNLPSECIAVSDITQYEKIKYQQWPVENRT
ncbi:hypothetical protein ANN_26148 [Periplaneta americana]|uniref:Uncharacterized protein n=1 Tax=Periplaneta americana TaxID=6978 RepID=A0ABQ8S5H3_PERAM|nr:hypothetical protein ANN_26148 [Periplaneta americana]